MKSRSTKWLVVAVSTLIFVASFTPSNEYFEIAKNLDIFATLYAELNKYYVDEINPNDLIESGIYAMLKNLDPYTNYISEDKIEDFRTLTTGVYGGIGALVGNKNGKIKVIIPYKGYSANKVGIEIGDEIIQVGDKDVRGKKISEITNLLKGQANTEVSLTVKRYGEEKYITFNLKREKIQLKNVPYYGMVTENIGMIKLTDFTRNASKEVANALKELKIEGAEKIILDLRGNPGGLLNEAINIANIFVPKGTEIVSTKGKIKQWNKKHNAPNNPIDTKIPIAVLIDNSSASAAEIVSGVIQDHDRGVVIGQRSFGKGLVQTTRPLSYNAKLKLTVAKYYIPSGRCIQEIDYSKKQKGENSKLADSLKIAFKTKNGRTVYERGGITPDITIKEQNYAEITYALLSTGLIFDYATAYKHDHSEKNITSSFKLDNQGFENFTNWLEDKEYKYTTTIEKSLQNLIESAKAERYYESIANDLQNLSKKVSHDKTKDLLAYRSEIEELIEQEIITHYRLQKGQVEASFDDNQSIQTAVKILNSPEQYRKILN